MVRETVVGVRRSAVASWRSRPVMVLVMAWASVYVAASVWLAFSGLLTLFWWVTAVYAAGFAVLALVARRADRRRVLAARAASTVGCPCGLGESWGSCCGPYAPVPGGVR